MSYDYDCPVPLFHLISVSRYIFLAKRIEKSLDIMCMFVDSILYCHYLSFNEASLLRRIFQV